MRSKVFAALALLALSLAACDVLVGLDKFVKCDACGSDASDDTSTIDASDDSPNDAFVLPDGVSEASSWPQWRMPNAPSEVEAGATIKTLASFTIATNGVITDNVSGNRWIAPVGSASSLDGAVAYCTSLKARVPTRIEAATLLDSTRSQTPYAHRDLDAIFVPDGAAPPFALWTSSYSRPIQQPLHFWYASIQSGDMIVTTPAQGMSVLCIL